MNNEELYKNTLLDIAKELQCEPDNEIILARIIKMRTALERAETYITEIETWKLKGKKTLESQGINAMFQLGAWWADRPWRNKNA